MTRTPAVGKAASFDFSRPDTLRAHIAQLKTQELGTVVGDTLRVSPENAEALALAMIAPSSTKPAKPELDAALANGRELVRWAAASRTDERRVVVRAFRKASQKGELISLMGQLQRPQSRAFIKDYLDDDGDMSAIAEWLGNAGAIVRAARGPGAPVDGWLDDAWDSVKKGASGVANAVSSAASAIIDGIETAGRSLGDIFHDAAGWTADRVSDLVEALVTAGKKTVDILAAAARQGLELVRGAVKGLMDAGRALVDIVSWAASQAFTVLAAAIDAALDFGRTVAQVMTEAYKLVATSLTQVVRAIVRAGRKAGDILLTAVKRTLSVVRAVLDGLLAAGLYLAEVVAAVCQSVAEGFRAGFIEGLIALGKGAAEILKAALETGLAVGALAFAAILEALGGHRGLMPTELAEARKIFGWSIDLSRVKIANASYPSDLIQAANGGRAFTTMYVLNFSSKNDFKANGELKSLNTLIHELTHVWQSVQSGPIYMIQALEDQLKMGSGAYSYTDAQLTANNGNLLAFGREQQAQIIEDYYISRYLGAEAQTEWAKFSSYAAKVFKSQLKVDPVFASLPLGVRVDAVAIARSRKAPAAATRTRTMMGRQPLTAMGRARA